MASSSKINWNGLKNPKITAGDAAIRLMEIRQIYEPMVQRALGFSSHTILWSGEGDSKYKASVSFVTKLNALFKARATNIRYDNELRQIFYTHDGVDNFRTCRESLWVGHWDGPQCMALRFWFANPENSTWAERPQDLNWRAQQEEPSWTTIEDQASPSIAISTKQQTPPIQATRGQDNEISSGESIQSLAYKSENGFLIDFSSEEEKAWSNPAPAFASHWNDLREIDKANTTETGDANIDPIFTLAMNEINCLIQESTHNVSNPTEKQDDINQISKIKISEAIYLLDNVNDANSNTTEEEDQNIDHLSKLSMNDINMLLSYPKAEAAIARAWSKARGYIPVKHNTFSEGAAWWTTPPASALPLPKFFNDREDLGILLEKEGSESSTETVEDAEDMWESDNSKEGLDRATAICLYLWTSLILYGRPRIGQSIPSPRS
jgi:hypothetical protein